MRSLRHLAVIAAALILSISMAGAQSDEAPPSWLLVVTGELSSASSTGVVIEADPTVVAFTDRPERRVATLTIEMLVDEIWNAGKDSFADDPPNAAIVAGDERFEIAELTAVSRDGRTVSFSLTTEEGALPAAGRVTLVIDSICPPSARCMNIGR